MDPLLPIFIILPLAGFSLSVLLPAKREAAISWLSYATVGIHTVVAHAFVILWFIQRTPQLNIKTLSIYKASSYEFYIDLAFDRVTATYLIVGSLLTFLVMVYSRYYIHREPGYKRFFNTVLFFFSGYNLVIFSGNMETLFVGWEVLGISSFLLIAFYRERYLPVKNAMKVFSIYRLGDLGIIAAMWLSHHLWNENITFLKLQNYELVHHQLQTHTLVGIFISLMILISAAAKSAQLPFSSWLPRAMEGPTPSSAIFYGSLSVHLGVFLLMRTFPFWEHQTSVRILIGLVGFTTSVIGTLIARVQSSVKSQIAYASTSQIGLIFVELAAGLEVLALIHFSANAFMRTYQLLVSPSVVTYLIREQFYNFEPRNESFERSWPRKIEYTLYMLSIKEWNLDFFLYRYLWSPLKWVGKKLKTRGSSVLFVVAVFVFLGGVAFLWYYRGAVHPARHIIPSVFAGIGLLFVLRSFVERKNPYVSWGLITGNHFWVVLAISSNEIVSVTEICYYLSGVLLSGIIGFVLLSIIRHREPLATLNQFNGLSATYPVHAFIFLIACLGLAGFPITPTFIGEDVLYSHIQEEQFTLSFLTALNFIIGGLAVIRIYSRMFLGPQGSSYSKSI